MLLVGTILGGWGAPLLAQDAPRAAPAPRRPAPAPRACAGAGRGAGGARERSARSPCAAPSGSSPRRSAAYANLSPGQTYTAETLDAALKDLYATELFADVVITGADTGNLVITVRENPVINRIVLEGNKRHQGRQDPCPRSSSRRGRSSPAPRSAPTSTGSSSCTSARAASPPRVEPKIVQLDQNRVDLVFEINEGDKSKVRAINIIGNEQFGDGRLRKEMFTKRSRRPARAVSSPNDSYDPDRLAADQQKLRAFYLTQGYADFRVVSALAELTPDRRDFIITYVVEEGAALQVRHGRGRERAARLRPPSRSRSWSR